MKHLFFTSISFLLVFSGLSQDHKVPLFCYAGAPIPAESNSLEFLSLYNEHYSLGYSDMVKNPLWVAYRYGNRKGDFQDYERWERPRRFITDSRTESKVSHDDYTGSGYDRGHMAPNSGMNSQYCQMGQYETYFMTNVCPQTPSLNRGIWQQLEQMIRETVSQTDEKNKEIHDVFILTGPIFDDDANIFDSGVIVPTHFYKIITYRIGYRSTVKSVAFIFPQEPQSSEILDYVTTVDEIEDRTGLNFFSELSELKQHNLESIKRDFQLNEL
jgi:endonuclease G